MSLYGQTLFAGLIVWFLIKSSDLLALKCKNGGGSKTTLVSGINIPLGLPIFGIFSRSYDPFADLKDLNFTI